MTEYILRYLFITAAVFSFAQNPQLTHAYTIKTLDVSMPSDELPYELKCLAIGSGWEGEWGRDIIVAADMTGDGNSEIVYIQSKIAEACKYSTKAGCLKDPYSGTNIFEHSSRFPDKMQDACLMDILDSPGKEIIITISSVDTLWIEIVGLRSDMGKEVVTIPAAVGDFHGMEGKWDDIHVTPLVAQDINNDGHRDLIFSRSAKPDSAIERGIVAFDVYNNHPLWFFPLADMVTHTSFAAIETDTAGTILACGVYSTQNRYAANGMDSKHAYLVALDLLGNELWRKTISERSFFYPGLIALEAASDEGKELLCSCERAMPDGSSGMRLLCCDVLTGKVLRHLDLPTESFSPPGVSLSIDTCAGGNFILVSGKGIARINHDLEIIAACRDLSGMTHPAVDLNDDGETEIIVNVGDGRLGILNSDFDLLAYSAGGGQASLFHDDENVKILVDEYANRWSLLSLEKRNPVSLMYARYKWWLAVALAALLMALMFFVVRWFRRLYLSSAGLPSLDKLDAMVIVLDRKKRIIFANSSPISRSLFGGKPKRWVKYSESPLGDNPAIARAVERVYDDPIQPIQERFTLQTDGHFTEVELVVYPRVDRQNSMCMSSEPFGHFRS